jgi:hypothetical protein
MTSFLDSPLGLIPNGHKEKITLDKALTNG